MKVLTDNEQYRLSTLSFKLNKYLNQDGSAHGWSLPYLEAIADKLEQVGHRLDALENDKKMLQSQIANAYPEKVLTRVEAIEKMDFNCAG